ncbi:ribonuclease H-like domain-containing protein, partial [Tanacetum coccineum]
TKNTNSTNKADNTAHGVRTTHTQGNGVNLDNLCDVVIVAFLASQPNSPQIAQEDLEQLHPNDLEEMDLQWEMAMLIIRARRFMKRTWRKLDINGQRVGFDKSKVECYNCHKNGHFARECRYQAKEEQPTKYALMAFTSSGSSSSSDSEVDSCSKTCVKAYATLKEQYDSLTSNYKKSQFNLVFYKAGLESVEARLAHYKKNEAVFEESINVLKLEVTLRDNALDEYKMKLEKAEKERDRQVIDKFKTGLGYNAATSAVESFVNLSNKSGSDKGYHSVPPPLTGSFIPSKPNLMFRDEIVESENMNVITVVIPSNDKTVENMGVSNTVESNVVRMNNSSAPIIEDWNSDDESEVEPNDKTVRPSTEKIKSIKTVRETDAPKQNKHHPRGNQINWNNLMSQRLGSDFKMINKACFVCGSFNHLKKDCSKRMVKQVWNNARRVNHQNSTRMTHPNSKRNMISQVVLMRSGLKTINTARSRVAVNAAKLQAVHNVVKRNRFHDVKASACWVWKPKNRVIDHVSNHNSASIILKKFDYIDAQGRFMSGRHEHEPEFDFDVANVLVTTAGEEISTASPEVKTAGNSIEDIAAETLVYIRRSAAKSKDKGKMEESESAMTKTKRQQKQERLGFEVAVRLQAELDKEERQRISRAEGLKTVGYRFTTAGSRLLLLILHSLYRSIKVSFLGKFDGKADEGYFVGYSLVSKAMRVFNKRSRIIKKTLNIRFLENTTNVKGNGPDWLFDVDSLSISMNYVPVAVGNKTNGIAGTKDNIVAGQAQKKKEPEQEYILIPLCTTDPLISQCPKDCEGDPRMKPTEVDENEASGKSGKNDQEARSESERLNQREMQTEHTNSSNGINIVGTPVSTAGPSFDTAVPSTPVNAVGPSVSTANESEEQLFERFSPFKNAFTLPPVPNISSMDNTDIFRNAYDDEDVGEEVDMNNVISSYSVPDTSFTKIS